MGRVGRDSLVGSGALHVVPVEDLSSFDVVPLLEPSVLHEYTVLGGLDVKSGVDPISGLFQVGVNGIRPVECPIVVEGVGHDATDERFWSFVAVAIVPIKDAGIGEKRSQLFHVFGCPGGIDVLDELHGSLASEVHGTAFRREAAGGGQGGFGGGVARKKRDAQGEGRSLQWG